MAHEFWRLARFRSGQLTIRQAVTERKKATHPLKCIAFA
ncbi:hypothetical protein RISK_003311 [Rhodopirellula islandica]|uniref:Uncharacterized protein n=1 Tax=Rhodopirellula islandica TaxID=595434 RepID=A0A0J1EGM0_RHOIS|nr:hypothetical protein RISK_003311 [Rhodopirellula islandica]